MTTATTDKPKEKAAPGALYFAGIDPLVRALTNGLLFAGKDDVLPALTHIRFEFDGAALLAIATDSYRLLVERVKLAPNIDHDGQEPFEFMLAGRHAKQALTVLKANRFDPQVILRVDTSGREPQLEFTLLEQSVRYPHGDYRFPAWRSLMPIEDNRAAVDLIGFNPTYLADLGKVKVDGRLTAVSVKTYGSKKPTRIDYRDGPTVLLVPYRVDENLNWGSRI